MELFQSIIDKKEKIVILGLGYVGMPLAVAFAKKASVIGFDSNKEKIKKYQQGIDPTQEVGDAVISETTVEFTSDVERLREGKFLIVAVPTPIKADKTPDMTPMIKVSQMVGRHLQKGAIIVYESTVYPGVTEDICVPILEQESGLKCGEDFKVGYSPERINPGDRVHRLENIIKIVSGSDEEAVDTIEKVYQLIIEAGIHRVSSIKVAEAAKVAENSQRDINIAFMNELALVFDLMKIDTREVIEAMNTKWNALGFYPGLVGGHCIGVDPYYFLYEAERLGYHSQIILSGRKINESMPKFITENIIKQLILADKGTRETRIAIMGVTFKENCPDARNSKVETIVKELKAYGLTPVIVDPIAEVKDVQEIYGVKPMALDELNDMDCLVFTVAHEAFKALDSDQLMKMYTKGKKLLIDVKGIFNKDRLLEAGITYWRL